FALPYALMGMHPGAVITKYRLGHKGRGHAVPNGDVFDDVLIPGQPVSHFGERLEAHVDFGLAGGGNFVVLLLDADTDPLHLEDHLGADILETIGRRYRKVSFLVLDLVAEVEAALDGVLFAAVPVTFVGLDEVVTGVLSGIEAQRIENE